jgi:hypothetical protein
MRRRLALPLLALLILGGLSAACSDDDGGTVDTGDVSTTVPEAEAEPEDVTPTTDAGGDTNPTE